jgi:hypothetical protein
MSSNHCIIWFELHVIPSGNGVSRQARASLTAAKNTFRRGAGEKKCQVFKDLISGKREWIVEGGNASSTFMMDGSAKARNPSRASRFRHHINEFWMTLDTGCKPPNRLRYINLFKNPLFRHDFVPQQRRCNDHVCRNCQAAHVRLRLCHALASLLKVLRDTVWRHAS